MNKFSKLAALGLVTLGVAGCSHLYDDARKVELEEQFEDALRREYIALADYEWQQGDFGDAIHYERKIKSILNGDVPLPEPLVNRDLPTDQLNTLATARNSLVSALAQGAASDEPTATAKAQAMFDCWVEQQEENFQPEDIAKCRDGFKVAIAELGSELNVPQVISQAPIRTADVVLERAAPQEAVMPAPFLVFFDFDKAMLTSGAEGVLAEVAADIRKFNPGKVMINGHADRAGDYDYNLQLSQKRADAVMAYFTGMGLPADMFATVALGESSPQVVTEDGKAEPQNRFVRIRFVE